MLWGFWKNESHLTFSILEYVFSFDLLKVLHWVHLALTWEFFKWAHYKSFTDLNKLRFLTWLLILHTHLYSPLFGGWRCQTFQRICTWHFQERKSSTSKKSGTCYVEIASAFRIQTLGCSWYWAFAAAAKSLQSCPTLCNPIDDSPPGSPVPGIPQGKNTEVGCHFLLQCMKVKSEREVTQLCPTLRDPMGWSPPGSSIHDIFQVLEYWRVLEWGAIAFILVFESHLNNGFAISHWFLIYHITQGETV